jgi:cytochrome P450 family 9
MANNLTNFGNIKSILKFSAYMIAPWLMRLLKITFFGKEVDNFFNAAVLGMMKDREEKGIIRNDMLNLLIQAKKGNLHQNELNEEKINEGFATVEESKMKKSDTKTVWSDEDLAAQAFIFFFAGFDTV